MNENATYDLMKLLTGLFYAYEDVNYIAANAVVNDLDDSLSSKWCLVGFREKPWFKKVDGAYFWVSERDIETLEDERYPFILYFAPEEHYLNGAPLKRSATDFTSHLDLCFTVDEQDSIVNAKDDERIIKEK